MLWMGEEYGEKAPFQFFSDHIDEEIATATREGRRREFAAFKQFGEEIPDPQAESTFLASKLTREGDPRIAELYAKLLDARRSLPAGDADAIDHDEQAHTLRVRRGDFELVCNFGDRPARLSCDGARVVLATHGDPRIDNRSIELDPLSGALIAP
jgi:maltooligosyltrehalose trehalohydrolase